MNDATRIDGTRLDGTRIQGTRIQGIRIDVRRLLSALAVCLLLLTLAPQGAAWGRPAAADKRGGGDDGGGNSGSGGGGGGGEDDGEDDGEDGGEDDDDDDALKLRLNDAVGKPGGMVALVIRTYAARPLRQGRITVRVRRPAPRKQLGFGAGELAQPARPLTFVRGVVFSAGNDAVSKATASNAADSQSVGLEFTSRSAGVNAADGPLAVIFMRLDRGVAPGSVYDLEVDPAATGITDAAGAPLSFEPIRGELRVRAAKAPYALGAEGDELEPGETAEMGVETEEPFAVFGGRVTLRWNPAAQGGPPRVGMDPRHGKASFRVERSVPGELVVSFSSPNGALNSVPGRILAVDLPTSAAAPLGSRSAVTLVPAGSWLLGKGNRKLAVSLESDGLDFR